MRRLLPVLLLLAAAAAQQWTTLDGPMYLDRGAAFDTHRRRLVMFSGNAETWEYDGDELLHRPRLVGAPVPPARLRAHLVYDAQRRHVLLFGGGSGNNLLADTWKFDGAQWMQLATQPSPPGRSLAAITYDGGRGRVLLFGGLGLSNLADTWEHDGTSWLQRLPATVPVGSQPVMTFDGGRGVAVLVTHPSPLGNAVRTYEWNGADWLLRQTPGTAPIGVGGETLAYDPVRQCSVLTGGTNSGNEVWEWNGATWTLAATVLEPWRIYAASWFDPLAGKVVVAGGTEVRSVTTSSVTLGSLRFDAFEWNGQVMTPRRPDFRPPPRQYHVWCSDMTRDPMVLFGGLRLQAPVAETWRWSGTRWTRLSPQSQPPARFGAATTFDWLRGQLLLFGGASPSQALGDLWAWSGTNWAPCSNLAAPPARLGAGFCFDLGRGVAVLFGGSTAATAGFQLDDTWEWNGASWTQRQSSVQPPPREGPAMTFDVSRGRSVLFGGLAGVIPNVALNDTWEWNGAQWVTVQPSTVPPALTRPTLSYDFTHSRSVLTGTRSTGQPAQVSFEIWTFDGLSWTSIAAVPGSAPSGPSALDFVRDRLVVASGDTVWEWSLRPASVTGYGAGCGAPAPVLFARARPRLGEPASGLETNVGAGQLVGFAFAETQANVPLGNGCTLLFGQPAASVFTVAGGNGTASLSIAIPDLAVLHGYVWYAQAGVLDPASPGGFKLTQGLRLAFGD